VIVTHIGVNAFHLISPNRVFDASLVPETWRSWFVDSTGVISQVSGESHYPTVPLGSRGAIPPVRNAFNGPGTLTVRSHTSSNTVLGKLAEMVIRKPSATHECVAEEPHQLCSMYINPTILAT
jgi:hypothetical protein